MISPDCCSLQVLLDAGASICALSHKPGGSSPYKGIAERSTPLHVAAAMGHFQIAKLIVKVSSPACARSLTALELPGGAGVRAPPAQFRAKAHASVAREPRCAQSFL